MKGGGLPHSEICGSSRVCRSPQLIAAYRVLRRLAMPRHPPCARMRLAGRGKPCEVAAAPGRATLQSSYILPLFPDYSVVKDRPARMGREIGTRGYGGRAWSRTRDLVLIRDAL